MEMFECIRNPAQHHERVVSISVFVAILCLCLVIGHLLDENRWVNESITAILIVFGFLTKPLIYYLLPHCVIDKSDSSLGSKSPKEDMALPLHSFEASASANNLRAKDSLSMLMERPVYTVHFYWRKFDDTYMRPTFGGPLSSPPEC